MNKIIAVDFDGTLCENKWPGIGEPKQNVIDYILEEQKKGAKLILWTSRCGTHIVEAIKWCTERGISFDAVNTNVEEVMEVFDDESRKIFATEYIDDKAVLPDMVKNKPQSYNPVYEAYRILRDEFNAVYDAMERGEDPDKILISTSAIEEAIGYLGEVLE